MIRFFQDHLTAVETRTNEAIANAQRYNDNTIASMKFAEFHFEKIEAAFMSLGLKIENIRTRKTGRDYEVWSDDDRLAIEFHAVPVDERFKFIKFAGYTARGNGKNEKTLHTKADKIQSRVASFSGQVVRVNPYSLKILSETDSKTVLVEWHLPQASDL